MLGCVPHEDGFVGGTPGTRQGEPEDPRVGLAGLSLLTTQQVVEEIAHAERLHGSGRNIADLGDPMMTHGTGGLVIMKDGVILGGIGVGGYPSGQADEDLSRAGLDAMNL